MQKIKFKYHPNVWDLDVFSKSIDSKPVVCECCGAATEYLINHMRRM